MTKQIYKLKELLGRKKTTSYDDLTNKILSFQLKNNLAIPPDLIQYFKLLDHSIYELDKDLYQFYSFDQFRSVAEELAHFGGIPNYNNIVNTLKQSENCFVFADYMANLFAYAIRLHQNITKVNEVYLICGDEFKLVAISFSDFLDLYFDNSIELKTI